MYSLADIADALETGLGRAARLLDEEQAVYGLDACDEVELHPRLAQAITEAGYGVHREQRYPADRPKRKASAGERCDFVLTENARPLQSSDAAPTLFADPDAIAPQDALWLEVKVVHQFHLEGANPNYASQLLSTVRQDVYKLSKDPGILHAALLTVLFVDQLDVANHDLEVWQDRCLRRGLPIGASYQRSFELRDRLGNGVCVLSLTPVHHL
jgi:hypothetical protein